MRRFFLRYLIRMLGLSYKVQMVRMFWSLWG